jgi:hypothetical protein
MTDINNFRIWFEYSILGWPPTILGEKYNIDPSRICNYARRNGERLEKYGVPESWTCERRWNKEKDGIKWSGGDKFYEFNNTKKA